MVDSSHLGNESQAVNCQVQPTLIRAIECSFSGSKMDITPVLVRLLSTRAKGNSTASTKIATNNLAFIQPHPTH